MYGNSAAVCGEAASSHPKTGNICMNKLQRFWARPAVALGLVIFSSLLLQAQQENSSAVNEDVVIRQLNYTARISKDAFVITVMRGDETVFQTGGPQDAAMNLDFVRDGK